MNEAYSRRPLINERPMELTLRYRGILHSAAGANRVAEKHRVRQSLGEQLAQYWKQDSRLDGMYNRWKELQIPARAKGKFVVDRPLKDNSKFWWRFPLCGNNYIPLLTHIQLATCELNIRLYRRLESNGVLYEGGDIDNRLKIFLDALQVPSEPSQVPNDTLSSDNPADWPPIFCLLDDDSAVTKLSITSLKLLGQIPADMNDSENYLELDADVKIVPVTPMLGTWMLTHP